MDNHRNSTTSAIGFCLLPSELIQNILLYLVLPEIIQLKLVSKSIAHLISDQDFIREYNTRSRSTTWLFVYKKRWPRDLMLHGFTDQSDRWFQIPIAKSLRPIISPGEDLYFLTASGNFFLFVSNTMKVVISVNLVTKTVKKIPPSPLGPRGTSSWRRSGMKLVAGPPGSDHFRFLFVELVENRPILFVYDSQSEKWESMEVKENVANLPCLSERESHYIYLSVINGRSESVLIVVNSHGTTSKPLILRPRFGSGGVDDGQLTVRFSWGNVIDRLHVYGDGHMIIMMSDGIDKMMLTGIELWGLSLDGRYWQYISKVPSKLMEQIKKPYGVMVGCLEERDGIVRAALMSNFEGLWHIIWLTYDIKTRHWIRVIVPDCKMKGSNMAGIAFSSGITLS
jgi:hypothetical protein